MRNKYGIKFVTLILIGLFLIGCANQSVPEVSEPSRSIEYGIGTVALQDTIGEEWKANQDVPTYSNGKVSARIDSENRITKILAYFNEADMADDYVLYFAGKTYSSIESITAQFGEFNSDSIIEYSDGKANLHVEITNKTQNEYYISLENAASTN